MNTTDKILIDTPPPTISGSLHMGHAFSYTQMDFMARYYKMKGRQILYPFGFDNNGIPTEKFAQKKGIKSADDTTSLSIETAKKYKDFFSELGIEFSEHSYHTFDEMSQDIAWLSFNDLQEKGLIYKGKEINNKCELCNKSIPNSEIENGLHNLDGGRIIAEEADGYFIKTLEYKEQIRARIEEIDWKPIKFKARMLNWIEELDRDWSIARKRSYGIPIPGEDELKFDTWFISSLTPQIAWAQETGIASLDCPIFDLRFQAHDIITTWALYTIIKSHHHNNQIPWKRIIITGHAIDKEGDKLSKSAGNFTNTNKYINQYGQEGIRHWAAQNQLGNDSAIDDKEMMNGRRLMIKLKNAGKFIDYQKSQGWLGESQEKYESWLLAKTEIDTRFEAGDYPRAFELLNGFFWDTFCGGYIEESKKESFSLTLEKIFGELLLYYSIFFPKFEQ